MGCGGCGQVCGEAVGPRSLPHRVLGGAGGPWQPGCRLGSPDAADAGARASRRRRELDRGAHQRGGPRDMRGSHSSAHPEALPAGPRKDPRPGALGPGARGPPRAQLRLRERGRAVPPRRPRGLHGASALAPRDEGLRLPRPRHLHPPRGGRPAPALRGPGAPWAHRRLVRRPAPLPGGARPHGRRAGRHAGARVQGGRPPLSTDEHARGAVGSWPEMRPSGHGRAKPRCRFAAAKFCSGATGTAGSTWRFRSSR
mmetsp:Transcript_52613/g.156904  ORF Transcript_52613/g.156904 Transcript_52613/m.156904 type:complete len:255 (-) Transcript_52613:199-963(-)